MISRRMLCTALLLGIAACSIDKEGHEPQESTRAFDGQLATLPGLVRIQRQRTVLPGPITVRHQWWMVPGADRYRVTVSRVNGENQVIYKDYVKRPPLGLGSLYVDVHLPTLGEVTYYDFQVQALRRSQVIAEGVQRLCITHRER